MTDVDCDLFVIGGGSGGVRAARVASQHGARVVLAEKALVGGTCVHAGCVPKKLLVFAAEHARALRRASSYGFDLQAGSSRAQFSWSTLLHAVHAETNRLGSIYEHRLREAGVQIERGVVRITGPHKVELNGRTWSAGHILLATGATPFVPEIIGRELVLTSDDFFQLRELPSRIAIVGGGYIALELACVLAGLGAQVTLLHRGEALLSGFDRDVRAHIARELPLLGIELRLGAHVSAVAENADGARDLLLADATRTRHDAVIFATGRKPQTAELGLEAIGVEIDARGAVVVDAYGQSSVPSVHAVGDVTGRLALTPVAIAEGHALADTLFGEARRSAHAMLVPTAVFSEPEIGTVGETEDAARARGVEVDIYRDTFRPLEHALDGSRSRALVKLVVERATQKVLGCHVVAPHAGEIVQGFAAAMTAGVTKQQLDTTVGIHPTVGEELLTLRRPVAG